MLGFTLLRGKFKKKSAGGNIFGANVLDSNRQGQGKWAALLINSQVTLTYSKIYSIMLHNIMRFPIESFIHNDAIVASFVLIFWRSMETMGQCPCMHAMLVFTGQENGS